jgi:hypothetical protein
MYQKIQVAEGNQENEKILGILAAIMDGRLDDDLKLLNFYREIPVSYPATVLTLEESHAELQVNQIQAVVISFDKFTVLKSSHFPHDVIANVNYVNVEKCRVILSNFRYAVVRAERRMSVRVELSEPIYASFTSENGTLGGRLHDMSLTGIAINVLEEPGIPLSEKGELSVTLPIGTIAVPASLLKILTVDEGYRMIFEIEATRATELSISQFLFRRQIEIIRELKEHPGINEEE